MTAGAIILFIAITAAVVAYLSRPREVVPVYFVPCSAFCGRKVMLMHKRRWLECNYCAECWKVLDDVRSAERYQGL